MTAQPTVDELRAAVATLRQGLGVDETLVLCGRDVVVTSKVQYANGTFQVTTKHKDQAR